MSACVICDGPLPERGRHRRDNFQRAGCDKPDCVRAMREYATSQRPVVIRKRREELRGERTCRDCGQTFPLDAEHFPVDTKRGGQRFYRRRCIECWARHHAAARARYKAKVRSDPERYARELEDARIRAALKRERETGRLERQRAARPDIPNAFREDMGAGATLLDARPLATWLDVVIAREVPDYGRTVGDASRPSRSRTLDDLAGELGVPPRRVWAINSREQQRVAFATADKLITNYGDVVDGDDMARMLAERCRAMPGNGERLLRYMDAAERIAHLAGSAVYRVADLYPEMA